MNLGSVAARVRAGQSVRVRTSGQSMRPRIRGGETVTVTPIPEGHPFEVGQVVLARVRGRWYLHLVSGTRPGQVQISNAKGHVNGWTAIANVAGLVDK